MSANSSEHRSNRWLLAAFVLIAALGIAVRIYPSASFTATGYDEELYRRYVEVLSNHGISSYPDIVESYLEQQQRISSVSLPPTRFLYIFVACFWHDITGAHALPALHGVSTAFSILLMFAAGAFARRLGGNAMGLAVFALMACAPTQIHMAQHALIDGFFAFWATLTLWCLWENLRQPSDARWLAAYTTVLALMVMTKENAAFAYAGLLALLGLNKWLRFGTITTRLLLLTLAGPLIGLLLLVILCGGAGNFIAVYRLLASKASVLPYAIATGDGPWYRYLVDLLLISPVILLLAWGAVFRLKRTSTEALYLLAFTVATYAVMCNVRYGMNLRYTNMWDMPLRYLAVTCLWTLTDATRRSRPIILVAAVSCLCLVDLRQYYIFFVAHNLYELVTGGLLRAVLILK